mgnify:CR=1 FL=1
MTPGDAHRVGVVRPRNPAILPPGPLIFNIIVFICARAAAAAFRARQIGIVCVARLSAIQRRRKADACASSRAGARVPGQIANAHGNNKIG